MHAFLRRSFPSDSLVLGVSSLHQWREDELLALEGVGESTATRWLEQGLGGDRLFRTALKTGIAVSAADKPATDLHPLSTQQVLLVMLPEMLPDSRQWWLLLSRRTRPFTSDEIALATQHLKAWQARFQLPQERQMSRLLLGSDDRLLLCDLSVQRRTLTHRDLVADLVTAMRPVLAQRYPNLPQETFCDLALDLAGATTWVRLRRRQVLSRASSTSWYIELRPLEADELPPVGLVKDPRVAQAITFLHENFKLSPSLADVAKVVHMSPFHFHRLFSKQVGVSPKHYLQRKQLQMAKWLLRSTRVAIGSIAEQTGFTSHGHFTSTFHRLVGVSPSEYREAH